MTGNYALDWAAMAVSLFNTVLLFWLGLTVLLNAEHRTWGVWLVGGGVLIGGAFFVSHSAILGYGLGTISRELNFWWRAGWLPVIASPLAWYVAMLWYAGFWDDQAVGTKRALSLQRQRVWLAIVTFLAVGLIGLLIFANPLPSYTQVTQLNLSVTLEVGGIPLLILVYPLYIILCIGLSLEALRHPAPSGRMMGDLARRRARPWLIAASMTLLLVSLLVAWVMLWVILNARRHPSLSSYSELALTIAWFDLAIALLIGVAVILLGRAIVSYEIFTGKALPRYGFYRHWRSAVILAAGYGTVVGWSLAFQLRAIYSLLLTTLLMVTFYALFSWRSFAERERHIDLLRPFVASQRLYERLLRSTAATPLDQEDASLPFQALCAHVLEARLAYLVGLGPLAPLVSSVLTYPAGREAPALTLLIPRLDSPQPMSIPLDPAQYGGALWAVPLWSERGLIGVLLLGDKENGGLYTQEEIEIARAGGERLIDIQASAELARRLMALQRQRLAQSQILDRQARRVLHDDILPGLHAAMLTLSHVQSNLNGLVAEAVGALADLHHQISDLLRDMPAAPTPEVARLGLIAALRRVVEDELGSAFDDVSWQVEPAAVDLAQTIPPLTAEVLFYAAREVIRNAAQHARGDPTHSLHLRITIAQRKGLELVIEDNGVGLATALPSPAGSGQGLALHSTMLAVMGGTLAVESAPGVCTRVLLRLPFGDAA